MPKTFWVWIPQNILSFWRLGFGYFSQKNQKKMKANLGLAPLNTVWMTQP
jgi:hypothetical protein